MGRVARWVPVSCLLGHCGALRGIGEEAWGACFTGRVAIWAMRESEVFGGDGLVRGVAVRGQGVNESSQVVVVFILFI